MSVDAKAEIVIERPRSEVAKIMFDPKCDTLWIGGLDNVFPQGPGAMKKNASEAVESTVAASAGPYPP